MKGAGSKNAWALFLLLLAGVVLGGLLVNWQKGCRLYPGWAMDNLSG